jgi:O-antigen biosynthesis protein
MKPEITLIITTMNSVDILSLFWEYLQKYTTIPFKAVVVDNGSTDGTLDFLKTIDVTIIRNPENVGVVKALDQAEKLVDTKYLLSISDDILVTPSWLEDLMAVYKSDKLIKTVAPIKPGTKIKYPYSNGSSRAVWDQIKASNLDKSVSDLLEIYANGNSYEKFSEDIKKANDFDNEYLECPPEFVSGCCVLTETEYIRKIGGFSDTRFQIYGCEDVDRCWRIGKDGHKVVRTSKVYVHHIEGVGLKNNSIKWKNLTRENNKLLVEKWKDDFWSLLRNKLKESDTIANVVEKYWIIGWLLESLDSNVIPEDLKLQIQDYLKTRELRLK